MKQQITIMNNHVDEQEMAQRLACLVVSNMPEERNVSDEDAFIELCNSKLRMSENISKADIANVSRLKRSSGTSAKPSMMIIRIQNQKARERVFKHKKNLDTKTLHQLETGSRELGKSGPVFNSGCGSPGRIQVTFLNK